MNGGWRRLTWIWTMLSVMMPPISVRIQITVAPRNCNTAAMMRYDAVTIVSWRAMGDSAMQITHNNSSSRRGKRRKERETNGCMWDWFDVRLFKCCTCAQTLTKRTSQTLWTMEPTQPINPLRKRKKPNPMTTYVKICQCTGQIFNQYNNSTTINELTLYLLNLDVRRIVAYQSAREESVDGRRSGHHPSHVTNHNAAQQLSMLQCQSIN